MRNTHEVATLTDKQATWVFCIPSRAETVTQGLEESLNTYDGLVTAFGNFVIPTEASVTVIGPIPCESSMEYMFDAVMEGDEITERTETLQVIDGITQSHLCDLLPEDTQNEYFITAVDTDSTRVRCRLADGDVWVDEKQNAGKYNRGTRIETAEIAYPTLSINFLYVVNFDEDDIDADILIYIFVSTWTDIWFEDTEIGQVNRDRLRGLLERIDSSLPVAKVHRESTRWESEMTSIF